MTEVEVINNTRVPTSPRRTSYLGDFVTIEGENENLTPILQSNQMQNNNLNITSDFELYKSVEVEMVTTTLLKAVPEVVGLEQGATQAVER
jgi:hypothetical protein